MDLSSSLPRVYTLPDCPKCEQLKNWLTERSIKFDTKSFDTDVQLEFIMRNMFGNPPILELGEACAPSEDLFPNEVLDETKVMEVLRFAKA